MKDKTLTFAQYGCGYWGPNLIRNFSALPDCRMKYVVDSSPERRAFVEKAFRGSQAIEDNRVVLADPEVDAVILATPAASHFQLADEALRAGKHVYVEKPLATTVAEVDALKRRASEKNLTVMAGHTFLRPAPLSRRRGPCGRRRRRRGGGRRSGGPGRGRRARRSGRVSSAGMIS